jgi:UDP-N-acetylglucosamine--N-acetylmuramyl-(pentapeptide) pyrophosphoryl-undecaprenol N-acetylglucosamine transferase
MLADFSGGKEIKFIPIVSGKWRRYFSIYNFLDIFKIITAFFQSLFILYFERPNLIMSAGGFVSVPLVWAAYFYKIPVLIHQQDIRPGLANKLMSKIARVITVTFEKSLLDYGTKAIWTGNPVKKIIIKQNNTGELEEKYHLDKSLPLLFIFGGLTGASGINSLVFQAKDKLNKEFQIIHLCGKGKLPELQTSKGTADYHYQAFESISNTDLLFLISQSGLVVSRAGLGALSDLSFLGKSAIVIPMPDSHQEENAEFFAKTEAALVLSQKELTPDIFISEIKRVFANQSLREKMQNNIKKIIKAGAGEKIAGVIWEIMK